METSWKIYKKFHDFNFMISRKIERTRRQFYETKKKRRNWGHVKFMEFNLEINNFGFGI